MNAKTLDDACMWLATFIGPWNLPPLQDGESEEFSSLQYYLLSQNEIP